ncbi:hypothetical protein QMK17_16905 [Rhodococcus sp. G-MC3]|uniref:hypothetical protein n=1 Tax=Rhodococcus sp. G-MC3 TaxID=3046209 RepID=UPI0024B936C8|nr:hypothetical protein [Rhodococcus sp. G-MC3]MDJ0395006.1 hypothetical protein [Rhodococcus sp. G-MC3]
MSESRTLLNDHASWLSGLEIRTLSVRVRLGAPGRRIRIAGVSVAELRRAEIEARDSRTGLVWYLKWREPMLYVSATTWISDHPERAHNANYCTQPTTAEKSSYPALLL